MAYPDETLAANDVGSRSFPYRDVTVTQGRLYLLDACDRYAVLVDEDRSQLRLVDLRRATSRLVLASPVSLTHQPSTWTRTKMALEGGHGDLRDYRTQIGPAQVSHDWLVWREELWDNSAGAAVIADAVYAAPITRGRVNAAATRLLAAGGMESKSAFFGLDFTLEGGRVIVKTAAGGLSDKGCTVHLVDLRTDRRWMLAQSKQSSRVESAMAAGRAFVLFEGSKGGNRGLLFDLSNDTLPADVLIIPPTSHSQDLRSLSLSQDGALTWAVTDDLGYSQSEVFFLSPNGPISRVSDEGLGPAFLGGRLFWLVASENGGRSLKCLDPSTGESFSVAGSDSPERWTWQVYGLGDTLVLPLKGSRGATTLRVFDVSQT